MASTSENSWRGRIGVLVPHFDLVPEFELCLLAPRSISIHAARVLFGVSAGARVVGPDAARAFAEGPHVDEALELLASAPVDVVIYGFTSSSYFSGVDADAALKSRLEDKSGGVPVIVPCLAALAALHHLEIERLALIHPPWFPVETDELGAAYFRNQGFEIVHNGPAGIKFDELPSGQIGMQPAAVCEYARGTVPDRAEAVLIGGNGFRAVQAIAPLEKALGRPVLTANQVSLWHALELAHIELAVSGFGQLLEGR